MGTIERTFSIHDTAVHIWSGTECDARKVFIAVQSLLRRNGFTVGKDPKVERDFKILSKYHREANHGELKCKIEHAGIRVSIEFYQSIVFTNPHGGEYDFDRLEKMPYLIRLRFQKSITALRSFLEKRGFADTTRTLVTEDPLKSFNESWGGPRIQAEPRRMAVRERLEKLAANRRRWGSCQQLRNPVLHRWRSPISLQGLRGNQRGVDLHLRSRTTRHYPQIRQ